MKNTKKKVLFVATVDSHIELFHLPYLKMFKDKGYEVHVATSTDKKIEFCDKKHKISIARSPFKLCNLKAIRQLKKIVNEEHFDIIHCHTPMGGVVARLAAKKARKNGTRVIYTAHGFHFYKGAPLKNWLLFYPVEKYLAKYTDTLITINNEDFERAKKKFGKRCRDIEYVPGVGVDEKKFKKKLTKEEKHNLRKSLGLKDDDFVIICVGRLDKNKNQGFLIRVLADLLKTDKKYHLLLAGKDEIKGKYNKLAKKLNVEENVHFLGNRDDVVDLLNISNVVVSASKREGLPVNLIEAAFCGLPIVALRCRGSRDIVEKCARDEEEFCNSIKKAKSNANNICVQRCLLKNVLSKIDNIYFRKIKVMHLLSSNEYSGAENVALKIIKTNSDIIDFCYCSPEGKIANVLKKHSIQFMPVKRMSLSEVKRVVYSYNPDIIHAHDYRASILASFFSRYSTIISHIHKNDPKMKKISVKSVLYYISSKRINKIISVSDAASMESIYSRRKMKKMVVIPNFVDKEEILDKSNAYKIKETYDYFYFGRLSQEKNPLVFIEFIKKLNSRNIKAVMIGNGPLYDDCKQLIEIYGLRDNIKMVGFLDNPFPYIKASKIGIMPSRYEGFGISAVEATILRKPVINSGVGGLEEIYKKTNLIAKNLNDCVAKTSNKITYILPCIDSYVDRRGWREKILKVYYEKNK